MSRSRRKTPITGITTAESDKAYKVRENRRQRRTVRRSDMEALPSPREFGSPWNSDKDGKQWLGDRHPRLMRK